MAEKSASQVGAYGGVGARGLDFGEDGGPSSMTKAKEVEGSFSGAAMKYAPKISVDPEDPDFEEEEEEEAKVEEPEEPKPEI